MSLDLNGDLIHLVHMPPAHTDGDVIVHFRDADVVHMGDLFFNGMYPFIDVDFGGNLTGMIQAVQEVLDHTNETTLFIPGHGPLASREDLVSYAEMLRTVHDRVRTLLDEGKTREEIVAGKPTADLDPVWVRQPGSREADFFVGLVHDGMVKGRQGG
jgi:glyoxylase-like metal-dependent hydrolase (beta-lactamase superfamily II)